MRHGFVAFWLATFVTACGDRVAERSSQPADGTWNDQSAWRLGQSPIVQIKGDGTNLEQTPLRPIKAFRLRDGRYVVVDGGPGYGNEGSSHNAFLVYDTTGRFFAKWGRKGGGPGEFEMLSEWAGLFRGDSIAAYDIRGKLEIFAQDGSFGRTLHVPRKRPAQRPARDQYPMGGGFLGVFEDGTSLQQGTGLFPKGPEGPAFYEHMLHLDSPEGKSVGEFGPLRTTQLWRRNQWPDGILYGLRSIFVVGRNELYYGTGADFSIQVFDRNGKQLREVRRAVEPEPVTEADKNEYADHIASTPASMVEGAADPKEAIRKWAERTRKEGRFAERKPAYSNIVVDDEDNLWVEHYRFFPPVGESVRRPSRWSVFDATGRFLGEVRMPEAFIASSITKDRVIGFWLDESGARQVHVYELIKGGSVK